MKKKSLKDRLLSLSIISSILIGIASSFVVTYAAIINKFVAPNNLQYAVSGYSAYFEKGQGSNNDPFLISSSDHLRNLQKLNSLGVFNENTYFQLSADITYEGDALLPIGTDDVPFNSQFDGKGHTITGLIVNGANTRDVGMFGYVGINGRVSNMILNHPTINLTANTAGDYNATAINGFGSLSSTNYLDSVLKNDAEKLNITVDTSKLNKVTTSTTSITKAINGIDYTFPITYSSSDTGALSNKDNGTIWNVGAPTGKIYNGYYLVQLTASTQAVINGNIINYTLERWNIELIRSGTEGSYTYKINQEKSMDGSTTTTKVFKSMWPDSSTTGLEVHQTYVGFFIGHLDGAASYLGMYGGNSASIDTNGIINVNGRPVKSSSCLIGRSREDNPLDNTAKNKYNKVFDFTQMSKFYDAIKNNNYNASSINYTNLTRDSYTTQNNKAIAITDILTEETKVTGTKTSDFLRIYPSVNPVKEVINQEDNEITNSGYLQLSQGLGAGTMSNYEENDLTFGRTYLNVTARNIFVDNGIWLWSTVNKMADNFLQTIVGSNKPFEIGFRIKYKYVSQSTKNKFQILFNAYNPNRTAAVASLIVTEKNCPATLYARWAPLDNPEYKKGDKQFYESDNYILTSSESIQETKISFEVDSSLAPFNNLGSFSLNSSDFNRSYYPTFCLGVGKEEAEIDKNGNITVKQDKTYELGPSTGKDYYFYTKYNCDPFTLDIYELELTFTSKDGNVSNVVNFVDYLSSADPAYSSAEKTWSGWDTDSRVKINFTVADAVTTALTYQFYRNKSILSNTVYGVDATNGKTSYQLQNTDNFNTANLTHN